MADVEAFVTLQTNQVGAERGRGSRGECRLADAGFTFEKKRPLETKREEQRDREPAVGDVLLFGETLLKIGNGCRKNGNDLETGCRSITGSRGWPGVSDPTPTRRRPAPDPRRRPTPAP
jgi:hypothetical protein